MNRNWKIIINAHECPNLLCINHNIPLKCMHRNNYKEDCNKLKCPIKIKE